MKVIQVNGVNKYYKIHSDKTNTLKERILFHNRNNIQNFHVLKNINFSITKGESIALIGTNGSGKSTLLKLLSKIIYPNEGSIITKGKVASLLELGAGFHPDFTGRENIYFNSSVFGFSKKETESKIDEIIEFSELGEFIDQPVRTYSSGMYMRLAFSIAINVDADIMLFDEILAVGDTHFQHKCLNKIKSMTNTDITSILVTHDHESAKQICTRAIWLDHGKIKLDGEIDMVISQYLKEIN